MATWQTWWESENLIGEGSEWSAGMTPVATAAYANNFLRLVPTWCAP
jgi:hypothetical protein